ncbi:MAG TPA: hypothetical protein VIC34_01275 [Croceibacterium sp.]|jgi:hypothetical protein
MSPNNPDGAAARRAFHRELRSVARILRLTGIAFALLGAAGLLFGYEARAWWIWPSWVSLAIGAVLIVAGGVRRVRDGHRAPGQL